MLLLSFVPKSFLSQMRYLLPGLIQTDFILYRGSYEEPVKEENTGLLGKIST